VIDDLNIFPTLFDSLADIFQEELKKRNFIY